MYKITVKNLAIIKIKKLLLEKYYYISMENFNISNNEEPISSLRWALYIFLSGIPLVGLILLIVWALGDGNIHRKNWARGMFIIYLIGIAIVIFSFMFLGLGGLFLSSLNSSQH